MRLLCIALVAAACGHSHSDYDTFQGCYDEHTNVENLPFREAVVVCCLDHPIDGNTEPCGTTAGDCFAYLADNLVTEYDGAMLEAACDEYVLQKGM